MGGEDRGDKFYMDIWIIYVFLSSLSINNCRLVKFDVNRYVFREVVN